MKVTLLQMDIAWVAAEENRQRAEFLMGEADQSDLYVLPEMWATGFVMEPQHYAENETDSPSLAWMQQMARRHNCAVCGSLAIHAADDTYRNRLYFVTPDSIDYYDKHHLFTHGHEHEHYTAGQKPVVVSWRGFRFLLQTCYDLRFPVFSRYGKAGEYDAIVYVANWPAKRQLAWDTLIRARAIENQCYVVAVNRVGDDEVSHYRGGSATIDPIGRTLTTVPDETVCAATVQLELSELLSMRQHFRVLNDRDLI